MTLKLSLGAPSVDLKSNFADFEAFSFKREVLSTILWGGHFRRILFQESNSRFSPGHLLSRKKNSQRMQVLICKSHRACLVHKKEQAEHSVCRLLTRYIPDKSKDFPGVWLRVTEDGEATKGGSWMLLICKPCGYCLVDDDSTVSCPRCNQRKMVISHRKNNGVVDGFIDADGSLVRLARDLFWHKDCCFACRTRFPTWKACLEHITVQNLEDFEPPQGVGWVLSKDQPHRRRCTGFFVCCHCLLSGHLNCWIDKFAYRDFGQLCRVCNSKAYMKPAMMWQSKLRGTTTRGLQGYDLSKHDQSRCEACAYDCCDYIRLAFVG